MLVGSARQTYDAPLAAALWEYSEELAGLAPGSAPPPPSSAEAALFATTAEAPNQPHLQAQQVHVPKQQQLREEQAQKQQEEQQEGVQKVRPQGGGARDGLGVGAGAATRRR